MGISIYQLATDSSSFNPKMKAFVAALSSLSAAAPGAQLIPHAGLAPFGYANAPAYAPGVYANNAPLTVAAAAPAAAPALTQLPAIAAAPAAFAYGSPYDYAGQAYPLAEPYIHQEIPAEEYIHEEVAAEPYVHEEI